MSRVLFSVEAERSVLGGVFENNAAYNDVANLVAEHFAVPIHGRAWRAIKDLIDSGRRADPVAVRAALAGDAELAEMDTGARGGDYFHGLAIDAPGASFVAEHAALVTEEWSRRQLVGLTDTARAMASEANPRPIFEVVSNLKTELDALEAMAASGDGLEDAQVVAARVVADLAESMRSGKVVGKRVGLTCVDRRLGGLRPGNLIVLAGRPSMGKTALARNIAEGCAVSNPNDVTLFLCCEMSPGEMMQRGLSAITHRQGAGIEYRDIISSRVSGFDMAAIHRAAETVPKNLIFRDCHGLTLDDVRRAVWAVKRKHNLSLVVLDYLQLMRIPKGTCRNDAALWGEITSGLKALARQAGVTILLLSQLSRQVESREDKRPMLSDLRESGAIEQDADAVLFVYREAYYLERQKPKAGQETDHDMRVADLARKLEVIAAKVRQGPVGIDAHIYDAEYDHVGNEVAA